MQNLCTKSDYQQVAMLHMDYLNTGFLSSLGEKFLALMYMAIDQDADSVLLVERNRSKVSGFITGTCSMRRIYWQMLKHPVALMISLFPTLLHMAFYKRCFEIIKYSAKGIEGLPEQELLSIVVSPQYRGQKVSDKLYLRLCDEFRMLNVKAFKILVGKDLKAAHSFYQRLGAKYAENVELHKGQNSVVYVQML